MKTYCALVFLVFFPWAQAKSEMPIEIFTRFNSAGDFYASEFGSVAYLPSLGDVAYSGNVSKHDGMPKQGLYLIPRRGGNCYFRVNHILPHQTSEDSYIGVTVCIIREGDGGGRNLQLSRNQANWHAGSNRVLDAGLVGPRVSSISIEQYKSAHSQADIMESDRILTFTWHAIAENGIQNSWDYRAEWNGFFPPSVDDFLNQLGVNDSKYRCELIARIIHFKTKGSRFGSKKSLDFGFNKEGASGAYIRFFSPLGINKSYYLKFEKS